jgi:propionyl-CoA carboxylase alpha chain
MFYDPMIAKLVTWGPDREAAIDLMDDALDAYYVRGVNHNMSFLTAIMNHERFRAGRLTTNFIAEEYPDGFTGTAISAEDKACLIAAAGAIQLHQRERDLSIGGQIEGREPFRRRDWHVKLGDESFDISIDGEPGDCQVAFMKDGDEHLFTVTDGWRLGDPLFRADINGEQVCVQVDRKGAGWTFTLGGGAFDCVVMAPKTAAMAAQMPMKEPPDLSKMVLSPMPGLLVSVAVEAGQDVKAGEEVCVVEAMKMENILRAEIDATVAKVLAAPGDSLSVDQVIVEFE